MEGHVGHAFAPQAFSQQQQQLLHDLVQRLLSRQVCGQRHDTGKLLN